MRFMMLCFVFGHSMLFGQSKHPCLRALIVHDTSSPDVQTASTADAARVKRTFAFIAEQVGLRFQPTVLKACDLSKHTLQRWLKTIRPGTKEVVLFYYSGRGKNAYNLKSKWPSIPLGKNALISEEAVAKWVKSHKPKLGVIIFDCYNRAANLQDKIEYRFLRSYDASNLRHLPGLKNTFRANRGIVMGCSSPDVTTALCSTQAQPIGGFFTTHFLCGLFAHSGNFRANWNSVISDVGFSSFNANLHPAPFFKDRTHGGVHQYVKAGQRTNKGESQ